MVTLEDVVVGVPHPRERAEDGNQNEQIGDDPHDENGIMVDVLVLEDVEDLHDEPKTARKSATGVNSTKMLQDRRARQSEPQWWPLTSNV